MTAPLGKNWALSIFAILVLVAGCQKSADRAPPFDADKVYTGADGRAYRLERLEKKPGGYAWVNKTMLRYYPIGFYEVEREDDAYFYVRQYVPVKVNPPLDAVVEAKAISLPTSDDFAWHEFDTGLPRSGQWRDNFAVADMNGDGFPDLVFAPARKTLTHPAVFLGDGKGRWTLWTKAHYPAVGYDYGGAAVADFNNDGKADIALGMHLLGVTVLTGDGKGQFDDYSAGLPRRKNGERPKLPSRNLVAYDWNGDGSTALVVLNEHLGMDPVNGLRDGVSVFLHRDESWVVLPSEPPLQHAVLLAVDASAKKLAMIEDISAEGSVHISERKAGLWKIYNVAGFPKNASLTAFALVDSKGVSTFAVAYRLPVQSTWWVHIDLIRQDGDQWQRVPLSVRSDAAAVRGLAFGNFRAGAFRDFVALDEAGEAALFRESGSGSYTRDRSLPTPAWRSGCQGYGVRAADLDKDGLDEIVLSFAGEGTALSTSVECASGGGIQAFKISSKR